MKLIVFVGRSNTGKTTLIRLLIQELKKRGHSVGAIKSCPHGFSLDQKGKDSWHLMEAGADGVSLVSENTTAVIKTNHNKPSIKDVAKSYFKNMDIVISEGGREETQVEKIEILRKGIQTESEIPMDQLAAIVADFRGEWDVPVFGFNEIDKIADFIENRIKKREISISLEVDEREVPLNVFLEKEFADVLTAAVKPLHGVEKNPEEIYLSVENESRIYLRIDKKRMGLNRFLRGFILNIIFGMVETLDGVPTKPKKLVLSVKYEN